MTVTYDTTQQKRAEEALAEKEVHFRVALDNMPGGIMLAARDLTDGFEASPALVIHLPSTLSALRRNQMRVET